MARGRMISRCISTSERFASLYTTAPKIAEFAQVVYMLLVTHSDDHGRQAGDVFTVKHAVVPASPRKEPAVAEALTALDSAGLITWYESEGRKFIQITDFDEHQNGLHKRTESKFPEIPGTSVNVPLKRTELNRTELNRTEQKQTGKPLEHAGIPAQPDLVVSFELFWDTYPKKRARAMAEQAWAKLSPSPALVDLILDAVRRQALTDGWREQRGRYIPEPANWLSQTRWDDTDPDVAPPLTTMDMSGIAAAATEWVNPFPGIVTHEHPSWAAARISRSNGHPVGNLPPKDLTIGDGGGVDGPSGSRPDGDTRRRDGADQNRDVLPCASGDP